ncbi:DUF167 domain-containing protein [Kamptonema cortianum]|jgi:uncharacterized protein (TIGR00251 family)|nr:DUF167 domain-containing protein [Kamptonema cortianum]
MRIIVHLTPKASHNKVEGWTEDVKGEKVLRVRVTAVPESGKANEALIKLLSAFFKVPKSKISIIRGASSRIKYIEIQEER